MATAIQLAAGCASTGSYLADRRRDAADIFTASIGFGAGAKARVGPVDGGACASFDMVGLRGGHHGNLVAGEFDPSDLTLTLLSEEQFGRKGGDEILKARGKTFWAHGLVGLAIPDDSSRWDYHAVNSFWQECWPQHPVISRQIIPYYTEIEVVVGLGASVRLGFNPGELLDFILGWTTIDIFNDDLEMRQVRAARARAAAGLPPQYPAEAVACLERLNSCNKDMVDIIERPIEHPGAARDHETLIQTLSAKNQLDKLGITVKWHTEKRAYEFVR